MQDIILYPDIEAPINEPDVMDDDDSGEAEGLQEDHDEAEGRNGWPGFWR